VGWLTGTPFRDSIGFGRSVNAGKSLLITYPNNL
jgi:hypothetical protein